MAQPPSIHQARRIAVEATCDPRTVLKYFRGESMASTTQERIAAALMQLGIADPRTGRVRAKAAG